jgi:hypothetical protein
MADSLYNGIDIAKAGERFGLSREDLESLFEDAETQDSSTDFTSAADLTLPMTQRTVTETQKGRGGTLSYKAPRTGTRAITEVYGGFAGPSIQNIFSPTVTQTMTQGRGEGPEKELQEKAQRTLESFIGLGGPKADRMIGLQGVQAAYRSGLTEAEIKQKAAEEGLGFNVKAATALGVQAAPQALAQYAGAAQPQANTLGLQALDKARQAGFSDTQIQGLASRQGLSFNPLAQQSLAGTAPNLRGFVGEGQTQANTMGLQAVEKARQSGLSDQQIRALASSQGLQFNPLAASALR